MSNFFAYLSRMKHIKRWGLMRNTWEENIQEHSLQVAMIAHALAIINNKKFGGNVDLKSVLELAVYHEASEVITGDLATPIKYFNKEIKKAYKEIEVVANTKLLDMLPEEIKDEYRHLLSNNESSNELEYKIVKQADKICAYLKCVEELRTGNNEFEKAKDSIYNGIIEKNDPAVNYFMEKFVPAFDLTLDELN